MGQVSPWATDSLCSPILPRVPCSAWGTCSCGGCVSAWWGVSGEQVKSGWLRVLPLTTSPTSAPSRPPLWDSWNALRGTRVNGFQELENTGQGRVSTAIRQAVSPLHTGHGILADTRTTPRSQQTHLHTHSVGEGLATPETCRAFCTN